MWGRIDDGWWSHRKVIGLSLGARGLWVSALSWSCHQRTAAIPQAFIGMVGGSNTEANELVEAGLWDQVEEGWEIHDWAVYQDKSLSEKRADAGRRGGVKSGESRRAVKQEESSGEATDEAGTHPIPSRPIPTKELLPPAEASVTFEEFWHKYPNKTGKRVAERAWVAALRRTDGPAIMAGLEAQLPGLRSREKQYRPHPSTWLNRDGWLDEPDSPVPPGSPRTQRNAAAREQVMAAIRGGS